MENGDFALTEFGTDGDSSVNIPVFSDHFLATDRYVYFIGNESGAIKIGTSNNPGSRLAKLQSASAERLCLLAVEIGDWQLEQEYHRRFAEYRIRGEWFRICAPIIAVIDDLQSERDDW